MDPDQLGNRKENGGTTESRDLARLGTRWEGHAHPNLTWHAVIAMVWGLRSTKQRCQRRELLGLQNAFKIPNGPNLGHTRPDLKQSVRLANASKQTTEMKHITGANWGSYLLFGRAWLDLFFSWLD